MDIKRSRSEDILKILGDSVSCQSMLTVQRSKDTSPIPMIGTERKIGGSCSLEASRLPLSPVLGISKDFKKGDRVIQPSESYPLGEEMKKKKKKYSISMKDMRESPTSTVKSLSEEPRIESCDFTVQELSQRDSGARLIQLAFRDFISRRLKNLFQRAFSDETLYHYFSSLVSEQPLLIISHLVSKINNSSNSLTLYFLLLFPPLQIIYWRTKRSVRCIRDFLLSCSRRRVKEVSKFFQSGLFVVA